MSKSDLKRREQTPAPVRIEKLVPGGDGLGHLENGVVFVPLTAPGDLVTLKEVRRRRGVSFARVQEILQGSPQRRSAPCPWFGTCGGCQWMHMDYGTQLRWKEDLLSQAMRGIARFHDLPSPTVHGSPGEFRYRYRVRLHIRGLKAGFYRRGSNTIVAWDRCMLLPEALNETVSDLRDLLGEAHAPDNGLASCEIALSPVDGSVTFNWLLSQTLQDAGSVGKLLKKAQAAAEHRKYSLAGQAARRAGGECLVSEGKGLPLEVAGVRSWASPGTFFQVNPGVNQTLVERVLGHLREARSGSLLDLYCGNGNFSLPAAAAGMNTVGVESSPGAVFDASSARRPGTRFVEVDAARFLEECGEEYDAVVLDPPRTGLPERVTGQLSARRFSTLLYVSCEPSTLARDLARLVKGGYVLRELELFDMFPQTSHFETLAVMKG